MSDCQCFNIAWSNMKSLVRVQRMLHSIRLFSFSSSKIGVSLYLVQMLSFAKENIHFTRSLSKPVQIIWQLNQTYLSKGQKIHLLKQQKKWLNALINLCIINHKWIMSRKKNRTLWFCSQLNSSLIFRSCRTKHKWGQRDFPTNFLSSCVYHVRGLKTEGIYQFRLKG